MSHIISVPAEGIESIAFAKEIQHRKHIMFRVTFGDGYENIFFIDVETGIWIEEDFGFTELAAAVGLSLQTFIIHRIHVPKQLTWHRELRNEGVILFGFYCFYEREERMYEIYDQNKKYVCTLVETQGEEWQFLSGNQGALCYMDPDFLNRVTEILPTYQFQDRLAR